MAAVILTDLLQRFVVETETDKDSPDNETTYADLRKMIEALLKLCFSTGATGTLTSDPPDDTTGKFEDTAAGFANDEHNKHTLVFTSGGARGIPLTIDDMVAADNAGYCTGDNLYDLGARSGDSYEIFYDLKNNADGHNHDGENSPTYADDSIGLNQMKDYCSTLAAMPNTMTALAPAGTSYADACEFSIYVPDSATTLVFRGRIKRISNPTAYARLAINGAAITGGEISNATSTYTWATGAAVDVSSLAAGWYDVAIQMKGNGAGDGALQGYTIHWV